EPRALREKRWEFLAERPRSHRENGYLYVHGSARNPLNEYVFPEDVYNQRKMERIFALVERYCFQGHTHVPGIFTENMQFLSPEEVDHAYKLDGRKTLCNVGSVGQPRDGNWRACYVLLENDTIKFRRVEYDVEATIRKIYDTPDLENFLGDRLREGRQGTRRVPFAVPARGACPTENRLREGEGREKARAPTDESQNAHGPAVRGLRT